MPAQRLPKPARRAQILDVALNMFVADGFIGTTISEIERRVGFTAGTGSFYRHFVSKEELLHAVVDREVERCMAHIDAEWAALRMPDEPRAALTAAVKQMLRDIRQFDRLSRLVLAEGERVPALRRDLVDALYKSNVLAHWVDDASRLVGIAALIGFHQFRVTSGGRIKGVSEDAFIETLVGLLTCAQQTDPNPTNAGSVVTVAKRLPAVSRRSGRARL